MLLMILVMSCEAKKWANENNEKWPLVKIPTGFLRKHHIPTCDIVDMWYMWWETDISMPWDVLSLNVDSGKTCVMVLLRIAPVHQCRNALYDRALFWLKYLSPMKMDKKTSDSGSRIPGILAGSLSFSRNFGEVNHRIEPDVREGYKHNKLQQKQMM